MARKLIVNPKCPLCGEMVYLPIKKGAKRENAEYVTTKRGKKQLFHTTCWRKMIDEGGDLYGGVS